MSCSLSRAILALLILSAGAVRVSAQVAPETILVLANARHPFSVAVTDHYIAARAVPADQRLVLDVPSDAVVSREAFIRAIHAPLTAYLQQAQLVDRITTVVVGPGFPFRIAGTTGRLGTTSSVDSEIALVYRRLTGQSVPESGSVPNPYFAELPLTEPRPFTRAAYDIYLVTRIDGRTAAEAVALVDRGRGRPKAFVGVVDGRSTDGVRGPEGQWLADVAARVQPARPDARIVSDASHDVVADVADVVAYASWGSNDVQARVPPVRFAEGAIASSFMATDARTMAAPPADWKPGRWNEQARFFSGSPEALAGDWLEAGLTGLGSQAAEPFVDGAFRPAPLFEAWARGYTLAESFYLALPKLSWQGVVFGDPLARAFDPAHPLPSPSAAGDLTAYIARSAAVISREFPFVDKTAATLMVQARLSILQKDMPRTVALLEEVSVRAPRLVAAQLLLGQQYEIQGRHDLARARYRLVLDHDPRNVMALNNLAYSLAVDGGKPAEALPFAERAGALGPNVPAVLDTLGWIRHLAGNASGAVQALRRAVAADPALCLGWEHLATAETAAGDAAAAARAGERAEACKQASARPGS